MNNNIKITYLWAEITGYVTGVLDALCNNHDVSVDVVHWDKSNPDSTFYQIDESKPINFYKRSEHTQDDILKILCDRQPDIVVVSGWEDKGYIWACRRYKKLYPKTKFVAGIDDQLRRTIRQRLGRIYYKLFYRAVFDFMWVAGSEQFAFARTFGYSQNSIISNLYSGVFYKINQEYKHIKRFVYCGRLAHSKGIDLIILAHKRLPEELRKIWPLVIIGSGDMLTFLESKKDQYIQHISFIQPSELHLELRKGGIGTMPSRWGGEQWGVAIHEYAQFGMPLLLSNECGAANEFLISGLNGFKFINGNLDDLHKGMKKFTSMSEKEYLEMSKNSTLLSRKINPEISAASLLSVLYDN